LTHYTKTMMEMPFKMVYWLAYRLSIWRVLWSILTAATNIKNIKTTKSVSIMTFTWRWK